MRLTPAQIGVEWICGRSLPLDQPMSLNDRIREGRRFLVQICRRDFGYDLQQWHDYLKESRDGGYTWGRNIELPRVMKDALVSLEWQAAVRALDQSTEQADVPE